MRGTTLTTAKAISGSVSQTNAGVRLGLRTLAFLAILAFAAMAQSETSTQTVQSAQPVDTILGEFNGVRAYSNGGTVSRTWGSVYINGSYIGLKWQCVEFVRRYYFLVFGMDLARAHRGHAKTFYANASKMSLAAHPNGGSIRPQIGDILASNGGTYGHVAIIRSVTSSQVCTIQQNFTSDFGDANTCLSLSESNGTYTVAGFTSGLPVVGWLRSGGTQNEACPPGTSVSFRTDSGEPLVHPNGTLIRLSNDVTYYVLVNGQKRGIPSPDVLHNLYGGENSEFEFNDVVTVSVAEFESYPTGPVVNVALPGNGRSLPDGKLVKSIGGSEISIVTDRGMRRPFPSSSVFLNLGYKLCNVIDVSDYNSYPPGAAVTGQASGDSSGGSSCTSASISVGQTINESLSASDCGSIGRGANHFADRYTFNGTSGQRIAIQVGGFDTYLTLFGSNGVNLASDDDGGVNYGSRIPSGSGYFSLPATGGYIIEVTSYQQNFAGSYTLTLTQESSSGGGGGGGSCSSSISVGETVNGALTSSDCRSIGSGSSFFADRYTFNGTSGQRIAIQVGGFDTYLFLLGPSGAVIAFDDDGGTSLGSRIPARSGYLSLPGTGSYTIEVTSYQQNFTGSYTLTLTQESPSGGGGGGGGSSCSSSIRLGETVNGALTPSDCRSIARGSSFFADRYTFNGTSSQRIAIQVGGFDTYLFLLGSNGVVIASDDDGGINYGSRIPSRSGYLSLPTTGTYTIEVTSYQQNFNGSYALTLTQEDSSAGAGPSPAVPAGFNLIDSATGVQIYRKDYAGGEPDFVTIVDLRGASIRSLTGSISGAPDAVVSKKTLAQFWSDAVAGQSSQRMAKVLINGTFFSTQANPTGLAFGLKMGGVTVSLGYGLGEYPISLIRTLVLAGSSGQASLQVYSGGTFSGSTSDVIGCLDPTVDKSMTSYIGRTFVGVRTSDGDSSADAVMFFSSSYARQRDAQDVLVGFGASGIGMLDGGGSTGLIVNGNVVIPSARLIPHAIAVYSGR